MEKGQNETPAAAEPSVICCYCHQGLEDARYLWAIGSSWWCQQCRVGLVAATAVFGILLPGERDHVPQPPAEACWEVEHTCKVVWSSAWESEPCFPSMRIPEQAVYAPIIMKLWEDSAGNTNFVTFQLLPGQLVYLSPPLKAGQESLEILPPQWLESLSKNRTATSATIPTPATTALKGRRASINVLEAPAAPIADHPQGIASNTPTQSPAASQPGTEPMEIGVATPKPPVLTLECPDLGFLERYINEFISNEAASSEGSVPSDPATPADAEPPVLKPERSYIQDFEPITPVGSPMTEGTATPYANVSAEQSPQPTVKPRHVQAPRKRMALERAQPEEFTPSTDLNDMTVVDSWEDDQGFGDDNAKDLQSRLDHVYEIV